MQNLFNSNQFLIKKTVSRLELLLGLEGPNNYSIYDSSSQTIASAKEPSPKGFLKTVLRMLFSTAGNYQLNLLDSSMNPLASLNFDEGNIDRNMQLLTANNQVVALITPAVSVKGHELEVFNSSNQLLFRIESTFLGWKYKVLKSNTEVALIEKKIHSASEVIAEAQTLQLSFLQSLDETEKLILLSSVLFIDIVNFEDVTRQKSLLGQILDVVSNNSKHRI